MQNRGIDSFQHIVKRMLLSLVIFTALMSLLLIPQPSYAEDTAASKTTSVSATIPPAISLEIAVDATHDATDPLAPSPVSTMAFESLISNTSSSGTFTASVISNKPYTLSVNALDGQTDMLAAEDTQDSGTTNRIKGDAKITGNDNSWGIKVLNDVNSHCIRSAGSDAYQSIPASITEFCSQSTSAPSGETTTFQVGISIGSGLVSTEYSSTLVITAANT